MASMAGRDGRKLSMELIAALATAVRRRAPGNNVLEFITLLAGRGGRILFLELTLEAATAVRELVRPDTALLGFKRRLVGPRGRSAGVEFTIALATVICIFLIDVTY